jgi:biofilm PGA synthesis N-glycosyltransferase PgaC
MLRNNSVNLVTRTQACDYYIGIAATKRFQSFYHGTLVAQGAFSLYNTSIIRSVGGWPHCVG